MGNSIEVEATIDLDAIDIEKIKGQAEAIKQIVNKTNEVVNKTKEVVNKIKK